jgi:hypothetical protein
MRSLAREDRRIRRENTSSNEKLIDCAFFAASGRADGRLYQCQGFNEMTFTLTKKLT